MRKAQKRGKVVGVSWDVTFSKWRAFLHNKAGTKKYTSSYSKNHADAVIERYRFEVLSKKPEFKAFSSARAWLIKNGYESTVVSIALAPE